MKKYIKIVYLIAIVLVSIITICFIVQKNSNNKNMNEQEKIVFNFYQDYFKKIYGKVYDVENPTAKLNSSNVYQLDSTEHLKFLNESGYFSTKFYENELPAFNICNEALKTVTIKEVSDSGGFPEDFAKNGDCDFVFYHPWVGGQGEELNTVKIISSQTNRNISKVIAVIGSKISDQETHNYSYPTVTLVKESGLWKIDSISISFNKPL